MPEDTNGTPAQPVSGQQVSRQQFADIAASHFQAVAVGLTILNPQIPRQLMMEIVAEAMGNVLSGITQSQDLATTLALRGRVQDIVSVAIRKRHPAITMAQPGTVWPANAG